LRRFYLKIFFNLSNETQFLFEQVYEEFFGFSQFAAADQDDR
jgi:hypothetical protein